MILLADLLRQRFAGLRALVPGIVAVYLLAVLSGWLNGSLSAFVNLEAPTIGIILGIAISNLARVPAGLKPGFAFSLEPLLKAGIILLGFRLDFRSIVGLGPKALLLVVFLVPVVLTLSVLLGRFLKADRRLAVLVGVGSCICGASAVVAVAPGIGARREDSVVAVSVVSFLGAVGVLVYTAIGLAGTLTDVQYGVWSGATLQAVAHCLAAAFARGAEAGEIATLVKMSRVVMLVPVTLILGMIFARSREGASPVGRVKVQLPSYVLGFIVAGILRSAGLIPDTLLNLAIKLSATLLLMAMIAMGLGVDFRSIRDKGVKGLALGALLFGLMSVTVYALVGRFF